MTAVRKANDFIITDRLFLGPWRRGMPEVRLDDVIIDAMAAHLVRDPSINMIYTTNFYADLLFRSGQRTLWPTWTPRDR